MSVDLTAIKTTIQKWAADESGIEFIFASQNAPKPSGQFGTIKINSNLTLNRAIKSDVREGDQSITKTYEVSGNVMVSINVYEGDALQVVSDLKGSLDKDSVIDYFNTANMGIVSQSEVRNVNDIENKEWEQRGQCDFFFNVIGVVQETGQASIDKIEVTDEINNDIIVVEKPTI